MSKHIILDRIKSSFPQGKPAVNKTDEVAPLPTSIRHDEKRNKLVIEVDLKPLVTEPHLYVRETTSGKGFNVLAGLPRPGDFAALVAIGDEPIGLKISRPYGRPSTMSFTVCDVDTVERIHREQSTVTVAAASEQPKAIAATS